MCGDPLSPPVSFLVVSRDLLRGVSQVAHLLCAVCTTVLKESYSAPLVERLANSKGPYSTYSGSLHNRRRCDQNQWVCAVQREGAEVLVNCSRHSEGIIVHRYLAGLKLAPHLLPVEALPGLWDAIVMEKVHAGRVLLPTPLRYR